MTHPHLIVHAALPAPTRRLVAPLASASGAALVALLVAGLGGGCAEWPRSSNLPDEDFGVPAQDVRALVTMEWSSQSEGEDAALPNTTRVSLSVGQGSLITGTLDGAGWSDTAPNRILVSPTCDASRSVALGVPGDWTGDVDGYGLDFTESVQLCAEVTGPAESVGWDLVLIEVDSCALPERVVFEGTEPVGLGLGGSSGGWETVVQPGVYQIAFAAYDPVDPGAQVDYQIAVSAVPLSPSGEPSPCPLPPQDDR